MKCQLNCNMMAVPTLALTLICIGLMSAGSNSLPTGKSNAIYGGSRNLNQYRKFQPMIARACNMVSLEVYNEIAAEHDNIVFSPFSLCSLLAVCTNGAKGKTLMELKGKLILKLSSKTELSKIYASVYRSFMEDEHVNITTSNVLLINKNLQLVQETEDDYRNAFNGSVQTFDPEMKEELSSVMDSLVSSATDGLLAGEVKEDDITAGSALFLSNTLTLSARWKDEFKVDATYGMYFYVNAQTRVTTDTMNRRGEYKILKNQNLNCDIIEIPYKGGRFAMYILLPIEKYGLNDMETKLAHKRRLKIETVLSEFEMVPKKTVDLYLPKFSISQSFSMKDALKANKIRTLFDHNKADLSGLVQGGKVFIKEVLQTSTIAVEEKGTVAGTMSEMVGALYSAIPVFHADHPFLYVLRDKQTDFNIFMGKYSRP